MAEDVTIRLYEEGDEVGINELFATVFGRKRSLEEWTWKFKSPPVDARPFIVLTLHKGEIVGQYPSIVCRLKYRDMVLKAAHIVDNMIHEAFRGGTRGAQIRMFSREVETWKENGVDLAFGFPNQANHHVHKVRLEFGDLIEIENLFKPLSLKPAVRKYLNWPFLARLADGASRPIFKFFIGPESKAVKGIRTRWADTLDEGVETLWKRVRRRYAVCLERDLAYLRWRYCEKPRGGYHFLQADRDGEILGLLVVKCLDHGHAKLGIIMECLTLEEPGVVEALVRKGLLFLSRRGADFTLVRLSKGDPLRRTFLDLGFSPRKGLWDTYVVYQKYSARMEDSVLLDPSSWHLTFGDCDSF